MEIRVQASSSGDAIKFNFGQETRPKKIDNLENAVIKVTKSIFKNYPDLKNIHQIHIDAREGNLEVILITNSRKEYHLETSEKGKKELIDISRKIQGKALHVTISGSDKLKELVQSKTPHVITSERIVQAQPALLEPLPEPPRLRELENAGSEGKSLFNLLRKFFSYHLTLKPAIAKQIARDLANVAPKDYRDKFVDILNETEGWVDRMRSRHPDLDRIYSPAELEYFYKKTLIETVNERLTQAKIQPISPEEVRQCEIKRAVASLQEGIPTPAHLERVLSQIQAHEMPYDELAKIPVTERNKDVLVRTWVRVFAQLYSNGRLDHIGSLPSARDRVIQGNYARKFMEAVTGLRQEGDVAKEVQTTLSQNGIKPAKSQLESLIIRNLGELEVDLTPADSNYERQQIYKTIIKPTIKRMMEKRALDSDVTKLKEALMLSKFKNEFFKKLNKNLNKQQKKLFTQQEISGLLYQEIENLAISEFSMTSTQIENFRNARMMQAHMLDLDNTVRRYAENPTDKKLLQTCKNKILSNPIGALALVEYISGLTNKGHRSQLLNEILSELFSRYTSEQMLDQINNSKSPYLIKKNIVILKKILDSIDKTGSTRKFERRWNDFKNNITNEFAKNLINETDIKNIPLNLQTDILENENVIEEIENEKFEHPSKVPQQIVVAFLKIQRHLALSQDFQPANFSEIENAEILEAFETIRQHPDIDNILDKFKPPKPQELYEDFIPSVFKMLSTRNDREHYKLPAGIETGTLELVTDYIIMKKAHGKLSRNLNKTEALIHKYRSGLDSIREEERLTLAEIGEISKLARYEYVISNLPQHPSLEKYRLSIHRAKEIINNLDEILIPEFSKQYKDGDILGYSGKKKEAWIGRPLASEEKMTMYISDYSLIHGMKVLHSGKKLYVSHIYRQYETSKMDLFNICISEAWRIDVTRLIPSSCQDQLQNIYGDQWVENLRELYHETERAVLRKAKKNSKGILNDPQRRINAGLADFKSILNFFGGIKGEKVEGRLLAQKQNFEEMYKDLLKGTTPDEPSTIQICSEFASKATLKALMRLNRRLTKEIVSEKPEYSFPIILEKLVADRVPISGQVREYLSGVRYTGEDRQITVDAKNELKKILKEQGYSKNEIDFIIRLNNNKLLDLPYDKREDLTKIHPGRMITLLEKKKCVQKIEPPAAFKQLVKSS